MFIAIHCHTSLDFISWVIERIDGWDNPFKGLKTLCLKRFGTNVRGSPVLTSHSYFATSMETYCHFSLFIAIFMCRSLDSAFVLKCQLSKGVNVSNITQFFVHCFVFSIFFCLLSAELISNYKLYVSETGKGKEKGLRRYYKRYRK